MLSFDFEKYLKRIGLRCNEFESDTGFVQSSARRTVCASRRRPLVFVFNQSTADSKIRRRKS